MNIIYDIINKKGVKIMASTLIQFRTDDIVKIKATNICDKLGIDLQTYMRMCLSRLVQENGIPFSMKLDEIEEDEGIRAMKSASKVAEKYGIANMSLEEINAEIDMVRSENG